MNASSRSELAEREAFAVSGWLALFLWLANLTTPAIKGNDKVGSRER